MSRVATAIALTMLVTGCRSAPSISPVPPQASPSTVGHREPPFANTLELASYVEIAEATPPPSDPRMLPEAVPPGEPSLVDRITLADLENLALANNPAVAGTAARVRAARGRMVQAGLFPNPVIGYHATEVGNLGTAGQQGAFVSQRFVTAGKLRLDQAMAEREVTATAFQLQAQQQRVLGDVRIRFYDALVAQRRFDLTADLARLADDLVRATQKLLDERLATENELLQAQIMMDKSHILHDNARHENIEAWRRLATVAGVPTMSMPVLIGNLETDLVNYDWEQCRALVLDCHPELVEARAQVERARLSIVRANREPIPDVDVMVSVRHQNVTQSDVANVQAGIPIPVFDKNQGNRRAAEAEWIVARNEVQHIELDILDRLAVAYRRHANAVRQVDRYQRHMIPRSERSLELVTNGYQLGQVEYLTLLLAQQTYLQVNLSYLDSLRELRTSTALIESQLLSDSLATRPRTAQ